MLFQRASRISHVATQWRPERGAWLWLVLGARQLQAHHQTHRRWLQVVWWPYETCGGTLWNWEIICKEPEGMEQEVERAYRKRWGSVFQLEIIDQVYRSVICYDVLLLCTSYDYRFRHFRLPWNRWLFSWSFRDVDDRIHIWMALVVLKGRNICWNIPLVGAPFLSMWVLPEGSTNSLESCCDSLFYSSLTLMKQFENVCHAKQFNSTTLNLWSFYAFFVSWLLMTRFCCSKLCFRMWVPLKAGSRWMNGI